MAAEYRVDEQLKEARKLRELFKGRFSDEEAVQLLREHDNLSTAVDFVLNSDPQEVRKFINDRNNALVDSLRRDSAYVHAALSEGVEACVRLFACGPCDHYWWRKVPARKEVSKCKRCKKKYDCVPREMEWGLAEFLCQCGNSFWGTGWMNHTTSPCYKCGALTYPSQIVPPSRTRKHIPNRGRHSCTGANCYNRCRAAGAPQPDNVCSHEQSARKKRVLHASLSHASSGSTVSTFMSQGELAEDYEDLAPMPSIVEIDED